MGLDFSSLNKAQRDAVTAPLGPVLVIAGAGSGKTRVLSYRIAHVIGEGLVKPENILALTFTNKAAKEMQNRVADLLTPTASFVSLPLMGTFHSIGARILRKEIHKLGISNSFSILDSEDQLKAVKEVIKAEGLETKFSPNFFHHQISAAKNNLLQPSEYTSELTGELLEMVRRVYGGYQDFLFKQNALDFDDLIFLTAKLFEAFPGVRKKYADQFTYVLVDEYQDTNVAQYRLLRLLTDSDRGGRDNLFVVGDDAQSIYGFRGSDIRNILEFEKDYPDALVFRLEQNYRSTKNIILAAGEVIKLNPEQKPKTLWTDNDAGEQIWIEENSDEVGEAFFVAQTILDLAEGRDVSVSEPDTEEIVPTKATFSILDTLLAQRKQQSSFGSSPRSYRKLSKNHLHLSNFVVLYRTHAQSRSLEESFLAMGIPYKIVGGLRFYERKEIKDVLAYLKLLVNMQDTISLKRVINLPARGVGEKSMDAVAQFILEGKNPEEIEKLPLAAKAGKSVKDFFGMVFKFKQHPPEVKLSELVKAVIKASGMREYLRDKSEAGEQRWENVQEMIGVVQKYDNEPWKDALPKFLEEVALVTEADNLTDDTNAVQLMTLHTAKGLEFNHVFFVGLEEGVLPHSRSLTEPAELSEEIRLAYVGLTRAKQRLFLSFARSRNIYGEQRISSPSRILRVLPDELVFKHNVTSLPDKGMEGELSYEELDF